ncbi:MAG: hypothetical protein QUS11_02665 [Candidatus Fermentibacter sp.]|nr:hypothetical protein [Candidatus Fermentibacter sp.]
MDPRRAVIPALALALCGNPRADSVTMYTFDDGRTVVPIQSVTVTMAAETVTVTPEALEPQPWFFEQTLRVDCVFHLVNTGTESVSAIVGFPFEGNVNETRYSRFGWDPDSAMRHEVDDALAAGIPAEWMIPPELHFAASIDGTDVPVRYSFGDPDAETGIDYWPMWALWDMAFPPGRDVVLRCSYSTGLNFHAYGKYDYDFTYITRTGALWEGPIGSAVISIAVPDSVPLPQPGSESPCWWEWSGSPSVEGRTFRWEMSDWEPQEDIEFHVRGVGPLGWQVGRTGIEAISDPVIDLESAGSLFESAVLLADRTLDLEADAFMVVRELRLALCGCGDIEEVPGFPTLSGGCIPDPGLPGLFDELQASLAAESASVQAAGYGPLLSMFSLRTNWHGANLAMYGADPSLEARFLTALSLHEGAVAGVAPEDPVLESFYRLTAWFLEGTEAPRNDHRDSRVFEPVIPRDSVLAWWASYAPMPLVTASRTGEPGSNVPFAVISPSPPFRDSPQVNSVLNDGDASTGWRSESHGGGHGEVLEAYVFPLPGPDIDLRGFSSLNGFGDAPGDSRPWVSKLLVMADGVPVCTAQLLEGPGWQTVEFPARVTGARVISFEIIEAVPGAGGEPAGISELRLLVAGLAP